MITELATEYGYLNARVKGMSRYFLTREFYDQILTGGGEDLLIDALLSSVYAFELNESLTVLRGLAAAESALQRNVFNTFEKVCSMAPDEPRRLLNIQISRWDVDNILAILRGVIRGATQAEIVRALLPVGEFHAAQLAELAAESGVTAVANTLATWDYAFASVVRKAIEKNLEPLDLPALERALYEAYFQWAVSELQTKDINQAIVRAQIEMQIDLVNVISVLSVVQHRELGGEVDSTAPIPGGRLETQKLQRIVDSASLEDAFETLTGTYFSPGIERGILAFGEARNLGVMERFLEAVVIEKGCRLFRMDPLSIGVPIGFVWRKYNEFLNLRILLRGIAYHMPHNAIRAELLFV